MTFPKNTTRILIALFFIGFATYFNMLFSDFIGDDIGRIIMNESAFKSGPFVLMQEVLSDRPLLMLSLWVNYFFNGMNPFGYKLINILIHCFCGISFYFLVKELLRKRDDSSGLAFFAAALFLVHPIHNQAVNSIIQRGVGLSTLFSVLSFLFFLKCLNTVGAARKHHLYSLLYFLLAVASKPNTAILPIIILIYGAFEYRGSLKKIFKLLIPHIFILVIPLLFYSLLDQNAQFRAVSSTDYFLIQTKVVLFYFQKYLLPTDLMFFYKHNNTFPQPTDIFTWLALLFHVSAVCVSLYFYLIKKHLWGLFVVLGYIGLMPESSFFSIMHPIFDHRNYFAFVFFAVFAAVLVVQISNKFSWNRKLLPAFAALAVLFYSVLNIAYTAKINTYEKWALYNLNQNPEYANFYTYTITTDAVRGKTEFALQFTEEAIKYNPTNLELVQLKKILELNKLSRDKQLQVLDEVIQFAKRPEGNSRFVFNFYEYALNAHFKTLLSHRDYIYKMNDFYLQFWGSILTRTGDAAAAARMKNNFIEVLRLNGRENPSPATFFDNIETEQALLVLKSVLMLKIFFDYPNQDINDYMQILLKNYQDNFTARGIINWLLNFQKRK